MTSAGICVSHLRDCVVVPVLSSLRLDSPAAVNLLLGTAAAESKLGRYLVQVGGGPALGIYQMEPRTHADLISWLTARHRGMLAKLHELAIPTHTSAGQMIYNLAYATGVARLYYWRVPEPLPPAEDTGGLARYWKRYWNTEAGAGTVPGFVAKYEVFVSGGEA